MYARFWTIIGALTVAGTMLLPHAPSVAQEPNRPVQIVVGADPGGGYDRMARAIQTVLEGEKLINFPLNITYEPGAGGAVAWASISRRKGDPTKVSIFSPNLVTNEVLGVSPISFENLTMLAMLVFEDGCFAVHPNGRIKTADDLIQALKTNPSELRYGFAVAAGNQWHVAMAVLADAVGSDVTKMRSIVFDSAGKSMAALLGQHVDVSVSGCATFAKHHEAGSLRVVAVSSPVRLAGVLASVPTWRELGHDVVWGAWRGILAPPGLKPDLVSYWEGLLKKVVEHPAWKPIEEENYWRTQVMGSAETQAMLAKERDQYAKTLRQLGLIK
jgi:putative tricarboxylic transport membrane protein